MLPLPIGHGAVRERHLLLLRPPPLRGEYVISNFALSSLYIYIYLYRVFLRLTLIHLLTHLFIFIFVFCFLFSCNLSIRRMHLPPVLYYLMSPGLRCVSFLSSFFFFSFAHISSSICHWLSHFPLIIIISYGFLCPSFFPLFFFFVF